MNLIFILAVALSVTAVAPLTFPALGILKDVACSRGKDAAAEPAAVLSGERDVELSVRRRLYRNCPGPEPVRSGRLIHDRYRLLERVGAGGMASVYRARDELLNREVAVKLVAERLAADPRFVERFRGEARLCAGLAHSNIVSILDAGAQPRDFIVMEFVDGPDAGRLLRRRGRLTPAETVHVVAQVCDALTHVHKQGVVHCDVSPSNILIRRSDGVAKLADFGLASRAADLAATRPADVLGTPGHIAPEILWGGAPTPRSDLYCLGIVAYLFLAGPTESGAGDAGATISLATAVPRLPALGELRPSLPRGVVAAVQKAVALDPDSRQDSVADFRAQLTSNRRELISAQRARATRRDSVRAQLPRAA